MYKIFLTLIFVASLNAELINGVAVVVKGTPITLHDIKEEMHLSKVDAKSATDILIRKKLEEAEITERKITVSSTEVYDDIKKIATANNMSVSELYEAVRSSNNLNSTEFKEKTKEKLLSQKLYGAIAYSSVSEPSEVELKEYYELHKKDFARPTAFNVVIYSSEDRSALQRKINAPMFYSADIKEDEQRLLYERVSPELAKLLENTQPNSFTQIVPDGKGGSLSFYLKDVESPKGVDFESVKNNIINLIMEDKREQVLSDYFARLQGNADIQTIREVE